MVVKCTLMIIIDITANDPISGRGLPAHTSQWRERKLAVRIVGTLKRKIISMMIDSRAALAGTYTS
jgi:hypothetical protein